MAALDRRAAKGYYFSITTLEGAMPLLVFALCALSINLFCFLAFGRDKRLAQRGGRRIPEFRLLLYASLGGAAGALLGMRVFRHKTRKPLFRILVPLLLALQLALVLVRFSQL